MNSKKNNYRPYKDHDDDVDDQDLSDHPMMSQQELLKQQDEGLELLGQSADRLNKMSTMISDELMQQNQMLGDMEESLDDAADTLSYVTNKTKQFIEREAGGARNCLVIGILSAVVIILVILIIYT